MSVGVLIAFVVSACGVLVATRRGLLDRGRRNQGHRAHGIALGSLTIVAVIGGIAVTSSWLEGPLWTFVAFWVLAIPPALVTGLIWITAQGRRLDEWSGFLEGRVTIRQLPASFRRRSALAIALMLIPGALIVSVVVAADVWT